MPKKTEIKKVMIIGSGPIVIGQAAEFDFSGSQACRALREENVETVLVNSNPATIQTDMEMADRVYIEPLTVGFLERIIAREHPDGILSGMGGQTALNLCAELAELHILDKYDVKLLGTPLEAIAAAEDRDKFREIMTWLNEPIPRSAACTDVDEAHKIAEKVGGYPVIVRAAYTLGGTGSGIATERAELEQIVRLGLARSRIGQVLIEENVLNWQEFEYEVMRDSEDNCITVCNMENLDPMGIHTGESIVIAPAQTLSDSDHQMLRSTALRIIRALGIEGGCNIQFALHPKTGEYRVIEVNPRVSRSSALASKATGYPIARIAAKIALGLTLAEIQNRITGKTFAAFEPALDYVVLKIPRWPFDKFRTADRRIGTQMKSTGEVMAIGRGIEETLLKAVRSLEIDRIYLEPEKWTNAELMAELVEPTDKRLFALAEALRRGYSVSTLAELTRWSPFFIHKLQNVLELEKKLKSHALDAKLLATAKKMGFADKTIAQLKNLEEWEVHKRRQKFNILPVYKMVDTCAAEFDAETPYYYSTYEPGCNNEVRNAFSSSVVHGSRNKIKKVLILGSGPIRIGQGIEFDYCCVQGVLALREEGIEALMLNNNPETVSTDFDVSDRLYFEPLTLEDVMNVIEYERPDGIIVQFGGQTALNLTNPLALELARAGLETRILGTQPASIDLAEDRKRFQELVRRLGIAQPPGGTAFSFDESKAIAEHIGYPVLVRPSYVLGGRGMEIVYTETELEHFMVSATKISRSHPVLVDKYLTNATEIDVDAVCDGKMTYICGVLEHIEEAGVHSGDASMVLPPQTLSEKMLETIKTCTHRLAQALNIVGLLNVQFALKDEEVFVLELNPRASRTMPFVSKATGVPIIKLATKIMLGHTLDSLRLREVKMRHIAVKASVFPFQKLHGVDCILGPEMKSTGEVMGIDTSFGSAYYKAMLAAGIVIPASGCVYISVRDDDKKKAVGIARKLSSQGLRVVATKGTAEVLREHGISVTTVYRISERKQPDALSMMRRGEIALVINTPTESSGAKRDGYMMRRLAVDLGIPFVTTLQAANAIADSITNRSSFTVKTLKEYLEK